MCTLELDSSLSWNSNLRTHPWGYDTNFAFTMKWFDYFQVPMLYVMFNTLTFSELSAAEAPDSRPHLV